ncbi:MAG: S9 family peptidase [bacterium]|nr:S9 family peptidase [bacterium]
MVKRIVFIILLSAALLISAAAPMNAAGSKEKKEAYVKVPETIVNQNVPPIPVEIKAKMEQYSQLQTAAIAGWDPHGKGMVVATRKGDTTQLYWLDKPMGKLKQLTDYKEPVRNAEFSPNPEKNYFLFTKDVGGAENYQVFRYDLTTGKATMITDGKSRHMGIAFNHKGDSVAYVNNSRTGMFFDVYIMNPEKPSEAKLVYEAKKPAYYLPSGWFFDDRHLLVVEYMSANNANTLLVDTVSGKVENITPKSAGPQVFVMAAASKDGKYVYGITDRGSEFRKMVRMERATKKIEVITGNIPWDVETRGAAVSKDMKKSVFVANEGGINRLYLLDLETLKYKPVTAVPEGLISGLNFDNEGKRVFMNINNARMSRDVFQLDLEKMKLTRWTKSDTAGLELTSFVMPQLIEFPTFDKVDGKPRMIPAFYYKPVTKTGRPYPVIISIHGGPEGQFLPSFRSFNSYLVNELGIAVIAPNVRGSEGYGKSYLLMDNWEKREDSVKDIGALLDWIAGRKELDKNRVAVSGGSYGGYMVLASMVHFSDRLACGVDIVGISNFVTFLKNTSDYRRDLRRVEYGDERKIGDFLNKISPSTSAHKIKKPLFVIQGKNDPRVPASEAEQIVATVRKNKVPVWYQLATNEGHGFRKKYNRDFMNYSILRFLQEFLLK